MCVTLSGIKQIIHSTLFFSLSHFSDKALFYPLWPLMSANKLVCRNPSKLLCWRLNFICSWIASKKCLCRVQRPSLGFKKWHLKRADLRGTFQSHVNDVTLTCMARMLRGMSSRYCRMVKCHVLILIRSSKANSSIRRPSVQTWTKITKSVLPHIPLSVDISLSNL